MSDVQTKICTDCGLTKSLNDFCGSIIKGKYYHRNHCRKCQTIRYRESQKEYATKNRKTLSLKNRVYVANNLERVNAIKRKSAIKLRAVTNKKSLERYHKLKSTPEFQEKLAKYRATQRERKKAIALMNAPIKKAERERLLMERRCIPKPCEKCGGLRTHNGRQWVCNRCAVERMKKWVAENPELVKSIRIKNAPRKNAEKRYKRKTDLYFRQQMEKHDRKKYRKFSLSTLARLLANNMNIDKRVAKEMLQENKLLQESLRSYHTLKISIKDNGQQI